MLLEGLSSGLLKLVGVEACSVQLPEQSGRLQAESCLDLRGLVEVLAPEDLVESVGFGRDAAYSAGPDGQPSPAYGAASRPRFVQWVRDVCQRPYDQAWLDYQHEIGLRHTHARKNQTDGVASAPHIPLRYVLAFTAAIITTTRPFLAARGHSAEEVDRMYDAWCKAVILHVTLWSAAYVAPADW